jgi:DNA topoisomerase-1
VVAPFHYVHRRHRAKPGPLPARAGWLTLLSIVVDAVLWLNVLCAIDGTAERLGNTRAVCRKYYIHPALIEAYLEDEVLPPLGQRVWQERRPHGPTLRRHEAEVLAFLKARV